MENVDIQVSAEPAHLNPQMYAYTCSSQGKTPGPQLFVTTPGALSKVIFPGPPAL